MTITPLQGLEQPEQLQMVYPSPKDSEGNDITSGAREKQPIVRTTASTTVRVGMVFACPGGLFWFKVASHRNQDMTIRIRQRAAGSGQMVRRDDADLHRAQAQRGRPPVHL